MNWRMEAVKLQGQVLAQSFKINFDEANPILVLRFLNRFNCDTLKNSQEESFFHIKKLKMQEEALSRL